MPKTFEDANEEVGNERENSPAGEMLDQRGKVREGKASENIREKSFGTLFKPFADPEDIIEERRQKAADDFDRSIKTELEQTINANFEDLDQALAEFGDIDLSELNQQELLALMVEQINNGVTRLVALNDQMSGVAALLDDIAGSVQDPFGISISGINDIDDERVAQPVVRDSDDGDINARVFRIRASESNQENIWLGSEDVEVGTGHRLKPGEEFPINLDLRQAQLYMVSREAGAEVEIIGLV